MSERPRVELSERARLTAVVLGAVIGCVFVLLWVSGLGLLETVVVLLPVLVVAAVAYGVWVWTRRRGHL